ncbi:MAG: biotin transporter BioY [Kiloniellales bacterium]
MNSTAAETSAPLGTAIAWLRGGSWGRRSFLVLVGTLFLAASSWIEVPMVPVPMTMQTLGMVVIGALYGWRLGGATVVAYLLQGAMGLPVLAGGAAGFHHFFGPTAGYLFGFAAAAVAVGWLTERGMTRHPISSFAVMLLGHAAILAPGVTWLALATGMGWTQAVAVGLTPFLLGMVLKSAFAAACLQAAQRYRRPSSPQQ